MVVKVIAKHTKNGKSALWDPVRCCLVQAKPEEVVRQEIVKKLLEDWKIPKERIRVEESLAHSQKGRLLRADIIIRHPTESRNWILFEIKSPEVFINDDTYNQAAERYRDFGCEYICLTNGKIEEWYKAKGAGFKPIVSPKNLAGLVKSKVEFLRIEWFPRPTLAECLNGSRKDSGYLGEDSPQILLPFVVNLQGLLELPHRISPDNFSENGVEIIRDGIRNTNFRNASGEGYAGYYRYFLLRFPDNEETVVSLGIFPTLKCSADSKHGKRNSVTALVVAVDDFDKAPHTVLQLRLDDNLVITSDSWKLSHDGRISSRKTADLLEFCRKRVPDLVRGEKIFLGELPKDKLFVWENSGNLILNIIRYAIARHQFHHFKG